MEVVSQFGQDRTAGPDVVVVADPRRGGANGRALFTELAALARFGWRVAVLPVALKLPVGELQARPPPALPCPILDPEVPVAARLVVVHDAELFFRSPARPLPVIAELRVVRLLCDPGDEAPDGRLERMLAAAALALGGEVAVAPPNAALGHKLMLACTALRTVSPLPPVSGTPPFTASEDVDAPLLELQPGFAATGRRFRAARIGDFAGAPSIGPAVAEALSAGLPIVAGEDWEPLLGAARLTPGDPQRSAASQAARELGRSFTEAAHVQRVERLIGPPDRRGAFRPPPRRRRRVLFVTSNGVGLGHLARCMAIARRLPGSVDAIFLTLSTVGHLAAEAGWHVEAFQHPSTADKAPASWANSLRDRLLSAIAFHRVDILVFDGNTPYLGLVRALQRLPDLPAVWLRRGLWRAGANAEPLASSANFELVLEPGELAAAEDVGPTAHLGDALRLAPIVSPDPDELMPPAAARRELGIEKGKTAILIQLGSGNNFDMVRAREALLAHVGGIPGLTVCEARSPVALDGVVSPRCLKVERFPLAPYLRAFDLAVAAPGYNLFHELAFAAVPSVFVPNLNPTMDDQAARARWAQRAGWGCNVSAADPFSLIDAADRLLDTRSRERAVRAARQIAWEDGAAQAACHIAALAHAVDIVTSREAGRERV